MDLVMIGTVVKSTGNLYDVLDEHGKLAKCRMKGKFRTHGIRHTNPVAVGDIVNMEPGDDDHPGSIFSIHDRKNYIIRKSNNLSKDTHIIAANIDQALLVVTLGFPETSTGFIDRFLATAEAYHIPVIICFNKWDIYEQSHTESFVQELQDMYENCGYSCIRTSTVSGKGMSEIRSILSAKTTLLSGHSGAGKSSILNYLDPDLALRTKEVSAASAKGQHTTTFAEMHLLTDQIRVIDTPGIRDFGIVDIPATEISHYFREMRKYIGQCRFNNCKHVNEPGCAVIQALEEGKIAPQRFESYLSILRNENVFD